MIDFDTWLASNDRYLADELAKLRARLEKLATPEALPPVQPPQEVSASASTSRFSRLFGGSKTPTPSVVEQITAKSPGALPPPETPAKPPTTDHRPALDLLVERLALSPFERDVLLLAVAMELDTRIPALCARAQGDPARTYPTFALAMALFETRAWEALSPERPLRYWRLLEIMQPGTQPLISSALRADERIVNYLKGLNYLDDRLGPLLNPLPAAPATLPPSQQTVVDAITRSLHASTATDASPAIQLLGTDSASKQTIAQAAASTLGLFLYRLPLELLPQTHADLETLLRLWQRERQLLPLGLYIDAAELGREESSSALAKRFVTRAGGLVFVAARDTLGDAMNALSFDVSRPTPAEQETAWRAALGGHADDNAKRLASHFDFDLGKIQDVAATAMAADHPAGMGESLWSTALARARPSLDQLAQRIDVKSGWDDLKLPPAEKTTLRLVADQVALRSHVYDGWGFRNRMNRGLAVTALFAGESGTGKTMAAEVLARELNLHLYRIDLSSVVSKYIGETEKNLRRLFDAAEDGGAILFFDEADALFGRRSEVKDSHDRYANIEVNYLLQRMESFKGLAILATNMRASLDSAFVRRLRFIVNFPFPGVPERRAIWASAFPSEANLGTLDLDRLAKLPLSGGSIHSIALNAAFMAARAGGAITMQPLLEAAKAEFRKLEKPVNEADFRWLEAATGGP